MTTISWVPRINITKTISVAPTISTSVYDRGDQIGGIMTLSHIVRQDPHTGFGVSELKSVVILDGGLQSAAIDLWFFNVSPTVTSSDNLAFSMSDENLAAQCIGAVSVGATYSAGDTNSVSTDGGNIGKCFQVSGTSATPSSLYAIAIIRSENKTFISKQDLQFQFSFYVD